jgi:hypothetical protein
MKKIIFIFLLIFSSSVFSTLTYPEYAHLSYYVEDNLIGTEFDCSTPLSPDKPPQTFSFLVENSYSTTSSSYYPYSTSQPPLNTYLATTYISKDTFDIKSTKSKICKYVGFVSMNITRTQEYGSNFYNYRVVFQPFSEILIKKCPSKSLPFLARTFVKRACGGVSCSDPPYYDYLVACEVFEQNLSKSEETAKTTNKLISESNSKLGSFANSNATDASLFKKILNSVFSFFGFSDSTESQSNFSSTNVDLLAQKPMISQEGACPSPPSFSVLGYSFQISFQPFCDFAVRVRPLVIGVSLVSSAWLILGAL